MNKLALILLVLISNYTFGQYKKLEYAQYWIHNSEQNGCGPSSVCAFGYNPLKFFGLNHQAIVGCTAWDARGVAMFTRNMDNGNWVRGHGFFIEYPFIQGLTYKITLNVAIGGPDGYELSQGCDPNSRPYLQVQLSNNPQMYNSQFCLSGSTPVDISNTSNPYGVIHSTDAAGNASLTFTPDQCYSSIIFNAYPDMAVTSAGFFEIKTLIIEPMDSYLTIAGPDGMCTGVNRQDYSIPNLPAGAAVCWTSSDPNVAYLSGNTCNPTVTLNKIVEGNVVLSANITTPCGQTYAITKAVAINPYLPVGNTTASSSGNYYNGDLLSSYSFLVPPGSSGNATFNITDPYYSGFVWTPLSVPNGTSWWSSGGTLNISVTAPGTAWNSNSCSIRLTAQGPCGTYTQDFAATAVAKGSFIMAPNPASNEITITSDDAEAGSKSSSLIYAIRITDQYGVVRKVFQYKQGIHMTKLPVADLKAGVYMLSVFNGKEWIGRSLILQK